MNNPPANVTWKMYDSIDCLPYSLWNNTVGNHSCITSFQLIKATEALATDCIYRYLVAYNNNEEIIAFSLVNELRLDINLELPAFVQTLVHCIRRLFPSFIKPKIISTGSMETYGKHFWFNSDYWDTQNFVQQLLEQIAQKMPPTPAIVVRDFIYEKLNPEETRHIKALPERLGGAIISPMPIAHLEIARHKSPDSYLQSLKSKDRYTIKKAIKKRKAADLSIEIIDDYLPLLDTLYPMYLEVNKRAAEFKSHPLPINFFTNIKKEFKDKATVLAIKKESNILAYALNIEANKTMNIYLVGLDYRFNKDYDIMYNILWESIAFSIHQNLSAVELGVSNYFLKARFSAEILPLYMLLIGSGPLMKRLVNTFARQS